MDRHDQELLSRQLQTVSPPRTDGVVGLTVVTVFFVGLALGATLFTYQGERTSTEPRSTMAAMSLPTDAPATTQR